MDVSSYLGLIVIFLIFAIIPLLLIYSGYGNNRSQLILGSILLGILLIIFIPMFINPGTSQTEDNAAINQISTQVVPVAEAYYNNQSLKSSTEKRGYWYDGNFAQLSTSNEPLYVNKAVLLNPKNISFDTSTAQYRNNFTANDVKNVTVFIIMNETRSQIGDYKIKIDNSPNTKNVPGYVWSVDVVVIYYPQMKIQGLYRVNNTEKNYNNTIPYDPKNPVTIDNFTEVNTKPNLWDWILSISENGLTKENSTDNFNS